MNFIFIKKQDLKKVRLEPPYSILQLSSDGIKMPFKEVLRKSEHFTMIHFDQFIKNASSTYGKPFDKRCAKMVEKFLRKFTIEELDKNSEYKCYIYYEEIGVAETIVASILHNLYEPEFEEKMIRRHPRVDKNSPIYIETNKILKGFMDKCKYDPELKKFIEKEEIKTE